MGRQLFTNNASTTLDGSLANGATSMNIVSGSSFPSIASGSGDYFLATIYQLDGSNNEEKIEIVKVTATNSSYNWTVERDFEGIVPSQAGGPASGGWGYPVGGATTCLVELRWTAAGAENVLQSVLDDPAYWMGV